MPISLFLVLLLAAGPALAQEPVVWLEAAPDSVGVGDTLEVRVLVAAQDRRLTSASAAVVLEEGLFAPHSATPFAAGDFLPGPPYENSTFAEGGALYLHFVAVSGTAEEGGRLAGTGQGELARFWLRALAPTAGTALRLEAEGPQRAIYTEEDKPGVEQRFALPNPTLQLRVGGEAPVVQTPVVADPEPLLPEPTLPEPVPPAPTPAATPAMPAANTAPTIGLLPGLSVAVGGESYGPLLARYLGDAEDPVAALAIEVAGDDQAAARLEEGRLVVRGLQAGTGTVTIRVSDTQGTWVAAQVEVEVRAAGKGPLLRALPKVSLRVGAERSVDLIPFVFDPDTPVDQLHWEWLPEGGVEVSITGTILSLRGTEAGTARVGLRVADPKGNVALAALVVQVEPAPPPPAPVDSTAAPAARAPDPAVVAPSTTAPDSAVVMPEIEDPQPAPADSAATVVYPVVSEPSQAPAQSDPLVPEVQPLAPTPADTAEVAVVDSAQVEEPVALPAEAVADPQPAGPDTAQGAANPPPLAGEPVEPLLEASPFEPVVESPSPGSSAAVARGDTAGSAAATPAPAAPGLAVEEGITHELVAGRIDSALVADRWVRQGAVDQIAWSVRGGKRLSARLDPLSRRLYLDARAALPGREVFFAEAVLGAERRQLVLALDVRAPRLVLLPFPDMNLGAGQELALDLDSFVQGDFAPEELTWAAEVPEGVEVELDIQARVLRVRESGSFALALQVYSPWGNQAGGVLEVKGPSRPAALGPDRVAAPTQAEPPVPPLVQTPVAPPPAADTAAAVLPALADQVPPRLWAQGSASGAWLELWLGADEELLAAPVVRVNGQAVVAEARGGEFRVLLDPTARQLQVEAEGVDLAGNAGRLSVRLLALRVEPGAAPLHSPDGHWQLAFPQARAASWVWFREQGPGQGLSFDAALTGPVELVAAYSDGAAPAIHRDQGQGWEELPTLVLAGANQVFARSEGGGVFKLAGRAGGALPAQPLAYPNPFNAQAAIRYRVAASGPVRVRVRDGQGRVVRRLVDQVQGPGVRSAVWDGLDEHGQGSASGVYYYDVEAAGQRWTGKLLLLR